MSTNPRSNLTESGKSPDLMGDGEVIDYVRNLDENGKLLDVGKACLAFIVEEEYSSIDDPKNLIKDLYYIINNFVTLIIEHKSVDIKRLHEIDIVNRSLLKTAYAAVGTLMFDVEAGALSVNMEYYRTIKHATLASSFADYLAACKLETVARKSANLNFMEDAEDRFYKISIRELRNLLHKRFPDRQFTVNEICNEIKTRSEEIVLDTKPVPQRPIPKEAPELWGKRLDKKNENPAEFIQRVWKDWLGHGLHTGHIRQADNGLFKAYEKWLVMGAKGAPEGFHLPTYDELVSSQERPSDEQLRHAHNIRQREYRQRRHQR